MNKIFALSMLAGMIIAGAATVHGQERVCGNELLIQETLNDPAAKASMEAYFQQYDAENKILAEQRTRMASKGTAGEYAKVVIPVVFHIVLSQAQIDQMGGTSGVITRVNSQLTAVNEDFSATNADIGNVPQAFKSLIGKANIEFSLAKRDPEGKAKWGIVYKIKDPSFTGFSAHDNSIKTANIGSEPWDNTRYLNIWVTLITAGGSGQGQVLGYAYNNVYAQQRYGNPNLGGVVMHYLTLGRRTAPGEVFYSPSTTKGRTLTHELGHYFNLWHIWGKTTPSGQKSCIDDDGIQDTPLQEESNTQCPLGVQANCPSDPHPGGEMYMNYLDYSSDNCTIMFSKGQVDRMRTETALNGQVWSLTQNPQLTLWPTDVSAVEYNNKVEIGPNPSTGKFNIYFYDKYDRLDDIVVTNYFGQVVKRITATDQQQYKYDIDITGVAAGMYIVQLHFENGTIVRKVSIQ